jgi:hypothetical protein
MSSNFWLPILLHADDVPVRRAISLGLVLAIVLSMLPTHSAVAQSDQEPPTGIIVSERFSPLSQSWEVASGTWSVVDSTYRSTGTGIGISTITSYRYLHPASPPAPVLDFDDFTLRARIRNHGTALPQTAGLVYQYQDSGNYFEALVAPNGTLTLLRVQNGVAYAIDDALFPLPAQSWFALEVQRRQGLTTVRINGIPVLEDVEHEDLGRGQIGLITQGAAATFDNVWVGVPFGDQPFKEDFTERLTQNWQPVSGQWSVAGGAYNNAAVQATNITLAPIQTELRETLTYTMHARMLNPYGASGNLVGLVFNYRSDRNYSELVFSPTGIARINAVSDGVRTTLATASYSGRRNTWFDVKFENNFGVTVTVDGSTVFQDVPANPLQYPSGGVGLITHWAPGRFDDVWFDHGVFSPCSVTFDTEPPSWWFVSGTWNAAGGTLNNTSAGSSDIATVGCGSGTNFSYRARLLNQYGASGNLVGLLYNYQDQTAFYAGDYFEVVFSPTGQAHLRKYIHGVRYTVATASHNVPRNVWFDVELLRDGINTTVKVNGTTIFSNVLQGELTDGIFGVVTHWSRGRFDDLMTSGYVVR